MFGELDDMGDMGLSQVIEDYETQRTTSPPRTTSPQRTTSPPPTTAPTTAGAETGTSAVALQEAEDDPLRRVKINMTSLKLSNLATHASLSNAYDLKRTKLDKLFE